MHFTPCTLPLRTLHSRCQELLALLELWDHYEKDVKELLGWIMDEANSFSKDVTTKSDKGIVDHMETCKVLSPSPSPSPSPRMTV